MSIRDLFVHDITRDIPPVVYFHDLDPRKVAAEVDEYIVTGGFPEGHPGHQRVPDGIHEQYVRLLRGLAKELSEPGGATSPGCWVSGFFGSGKSSFAKLLGLSLDGLVLPDGSPLADRWLARDQTARRAELVEAWHALLTQLGSAPMAVVFDVGAVAKDDEHVHAAVVRQVQARLGYSTHRTVAREEVALERDGLWDRFLELAQRLHGRPWSETVKLHRADRHFSEVMHELDPKLYDRPLEWLTQHGGDVARAQSADEAVDDIAHMLARRAPGQTLFIVVDEVSQYVISGDDRIGKLQAFVELLGARLRGKAWLVALGQQKLEEDAAARTDLPKLKDRFPKRLRVHLDPANIEDVVNQRLLKKQPSEEPRLRRLFREQRHAIEAHALGGMDLDEDAFVATYPVLPAYVPLLLRITSALRRSSRAQADDHEIRGLLQLLGEVFRVRGHADRDLGVLVAIDDIYEVQRTALDAETQQSMSRVLANCGPDPLYTRVAKAVAMLQLVQDDTSVNTGGTDAALVTRALFDSVHAPDRTEAVTEALETLRRKNLLGYSERTGYKIQSSAAEEWERERRDIDVSADQVAELVRVALTNLVAEPDLPRHKGRPFPVGARFSDDATAQDAVLTDPRDPAAVIFDLRWVRDASEATWRRRSSEEALRDRIVWVAADVAGVKAAAEELGKSVGMLRKLEPSYKTNSLLPGRKMLYLAEEGRKDDLLARLSKAVDAAWTHGAMYFRGRPFQASELGATFPQATQAAGNRLLGDLFPEFVPTQVSPSELAQLVPVELAGPSTKFLSGELGLLDVERGRYVASCAGVVPQRVLQTIETDKGIGGTVLLARFGAPPYGWNAGVVKAAVAALLRKGSIRITLEDGTAVAYLRDAGVPDLFDKDRAFKRANFYPAGDDGISPPVRNKIRKFLQNAFGQEIDAPNDAIADAVARQFPKLQDRLRDVQRRLNQLVRRPSDLPGLVGLDEGIEKCLRVSRNTQSTVEAVAKNLDALKDGISALDRLDLELTADAIKATNRAIASCDQLLAQLADLGPLEADLAARRERLLAQIGAERPWVDIGSVKADVEAAEASYQRARGALLASRQARCDAEKATIARRPGFEKLSDDDAHDALQPIEAVLTPTTDTATLPSLVALRDAFEAGLRRAVAEANRKVDQHLSAKEQPVVHVETHITNREVTNEAELDAFLVELRTLIAAQLAAGRRVRLT